MGKQQEYKDAQDYYDRNYWGIWNNQPEKGAVYDALQEMKREAELEAATEAKQNNENQGNRVTVPISSGTTWSDSEIVLTITALGFFIYLYVKRHVIGNWISTNPFESFFIGALMVEFFCLLAFLKKVMDGTEMELSSGFWATLIVGIGLSYLGQFLVLLGVFCVFLYKIIRYHFIWEVIESLQMLRHRKAWLIVDASTLALWLIIHICKGI